MRSSVDATCLWPNEHRHADAGLAPYASRADHSRGRRHTEAPVRLRDAYQRDRDRVVHCTAFRRLVYKTQVFLNHEAICSAPASRTRSRWLSWGDRSRAPWR